LYPGGILRKQGGIVVITDEERRDPRFQFGYLKACLREVRPFLEIIAAAPDRHSWEKVRVTLSGDTPRTVKRLLNLMDEISGEKEGV
jgi:hypothetical protein